MDISLLRLSGLAVSMLLLVTLTLKLRKQTASNLLILLLAFSSISIFIAASYPNLIGYISSVFLPNLPGMRLIALIGTATIVVFALLFYIFSIIEEHRKQLDGICKYLALEKITKKYKLGKAGIKPIVVIVPVFNEDKNISQVLDVMPKEINTHKVVVLLIDDGSTDQTEQIALKYETIFLKHPVNRGGGAAIRTGFEAAKKFDPAAVVTMDGDGQHDPREIKVLIDPVINGCADCVIGSRVLAKQVASSRLRGAGIVFFSFLISMITKQKITDCSSGFRVFSTRAIDRVNLRQDQYHTAEMIIELSKYKFNTIELPVRMKNRTSGQSKKGPDVLYGVYFLIAIISSWLRA